MRFLGLDYGDKTIGVAVSDPEGRIALGVETIRRAEAPALRASFRRLASLMKEYEIGTIVLGYPKNMDGSLSARCEITHAFKEKLETHFKQANVVLWDERLSTAAVLRTKADGVKSAAVDEMAAIYILQGYLDRLRKEQNHMENETNDAFAWNEEDGGVITLFDDDGNESSFTVLSSRENEGCLYLLVADTAEVEEGEDEDAEEAVVEVLHFKCVANGEEEMAFELVDEEHEDFNLVLELFKEDYETLEIDVDEEE